jgi:uncharacterized protein (TIGR03000 family)
MLGRLLFRTGSRLLAAGMIFAAAGISFAQTPGAVGGRPGAYPVNPANNAFQQEEGLRSYYLSHPYRYYGYPSSTDPSLSASPSWLGGLPLGTRYAEPADSHRPELPYGFFDNTPPAGPPRRPFVALTTSDTSALLTVRVPANAEVWVEGVKTSSTGPLRRFQSPPLQPGQRYVYTVRAQWQENGQPVTDTHKVDVAAGANISVNFQYPAPRVTR